ncbi:hypothetical protein M5X05_16055 [Paenibacillus alvei]|nr:hypothetical protein [Paenibacillus alvei]MCY9705705.1 hypothetical protein [Paenibacillus alvei]
MKLSNKAQIIQYSKNSSFLNQILPQAAHITPLEEQIKAAAAQLFDSTPQILYMLK